MTRLPVRRALAPLLLLQPGELEVRGSWKVVAGRVEADENCFRIETLTRSYLHEVAHDDSGWDTLYVDPCDGRHWELTYPDSQSQGGGPPSLKHLTAEQARAKYLVET